MYLCVFYIYIGRSRYSANFAFSDKDLKPPNSAYHMNLQQARFPLSDAFAGKLEAMYAAEEA